MAKIQTKNLVSWSRFQWRKEVLGIGYEKWAKARKREKIVLVQLLTKQENENPSSINKFSLSTSFRKSPYNPGFLQQSVNDLSHGLHSILVLLRWNNIHFVSFRQPEKSLENPPIIFLIGMSSRNDGIQIKNLVSWSRYQWATGLLEKALQEVGEGKKRKEIVIWTRAQLQIQLVDEFS